MRASALSTSVFCTLLYATLLAVCFSSQVAVHQGREATVDCDVLPCFMTDCTHENQTFPAGCPGAVWYGTHKPSKRYCEGNGYKGKTFPWWSTCCSWETASNGYESCVLRREHNRKLNIVGQVCGDRVSNCNGLKLSDGNKNAIGPRADLYTCAAPVWVQVDLGQTKTVDSVRLWHYHADKRKYCGQSVQLSVDEVHWTTVYDTGTGYGDEETKEGKLVSFPSQLARYVRHYSGPSDLNSGVHFLEVDVYGPKLDIVGQVCDHRIPNCAGRKLSDGNKNPNEWRENPNAGGVTCAAPVWVQVDLGQTKTVDSVRFWHYYADTRQYCGQSVQLSVDEVHWTTVYDTGTGYGDWETIDGKSVSFPPQLARYVRHYSGPSNKNAGVHFLEVDVYGTLVHTHTNSNPELTGADHNWGNGDLGLCEGACDNDAQCKGDLKCFLRTGFTPVPGCSGTGIEDWDYCYDATGSKELEGDVDNSSPLDACNGKCDTDEQCKGGLKCFQREHGETIPGCIGTGGNQSDYCYDPNWSAAGPVTSRISDKTGRIDEIHAHAGESDGQHSNATEEEIAMAAKGAHKSETDYRKDVTEGGCCFFPQMPADGEGLPFQTDFDIDAFNGLSTADVEGSQVISFSVSAGESFNIVATSPSIAFQCGKGEQIKEALDICAALPISDAGEAWNAMGFENSPTITASLFGYQFDVLGTLQSWQEMDENDKVNTTTTKQKIGDKAAAFDFGDTALCFAFQAGLFSKDCAMGFAFAQSGLLAASCSLNPASVVVCPGIDGLPTIDLELLSFGFSSWRDLEQESFIAFWNGDHWNGDHWSLVSEALDGEKLKFKGVLCMMGTITFTAFDFTPAFLGQTFEVGVSMTVAAIIDIVLPSFEDLKDIFKQLAAGDLGQLMNGDIAGETMKKLPGFQLAVSGDLTLTCDLHHFAIEFTPGAAGLTIGFNMGEFYSGFSNGLYMAATYQMSLIDVIPPLGNEFFICRGRNVFEEITGTYDVGMYMSTSAGIGFGLEFDLNIVGNTLSFKARVHASDLVVGAEFSFNVSSTTFGVGVEAGATWEQGLKPFFRISKTPEHLTTLLDSLKKGCLEGAESLTSSLLNTIKGWFAIAHEEFIQWKNARQAAQRAQGLIIHVKPYWISKSKPAETVEEVEEFLAMSSKSKPRKLLATDSSKVAVEGLIQKATTQTRVQGKNKRWGGMPHLHHRHHRHHFHHRHHRHHFHHRHSFFKAISHAANAVVNAVEHVAETVQETVQEVVETASDWYKKAAPELVFEIYKNEYILTICDFKLEISVRAGAKLFGKMYTKSYHIAIEITIGDILEKVRTAVEAGFIAVKDTVKDAFEWELRKRYLAAEEQELALQKKGRPSAKGNSR